MRCRRWRLRSPGRRASRGSRASSVFRIVRFVRGRADFWDRLELLTRSRRSRLPSGIGDEFEYGSARADCAERVGRRPGLNVEAALDLGSEAVEERLDDFGLVGVGEFADSQRLGSRAAAQCNAAGRARIAGPCCLAACGDQYQASVEFEQVDRSGEEFARFSAADFEQSHVAGGDSESEEPAHEAVEEAIEWAFRLKIVGHDVASIYKDGERAKQGRNARRERTRKSKPPAGFGLPVCKEKRRCGASRLYEVFV